MENLIVGTSMENLIVGTSMENLIVLLIVCVLAEF
jgi:hypothetical protein